MRDKEFCVSVNVLVFKKFEFFKFKKKTVFLCVVHMCELLICMHSVHFMNGQSFIRERDSHIIIH
jgi:hypothetical protein